MKTFKIKSYYSPLEAKLEKAKLINARIDYFLSNENTNVIYHKIYNYDITIDLFVDETDLDKVIKILDLKNGPVRYPSCNSREFKVIKSFSEWVLFIFLSFTAPNRSYEVGSSKCKKCGTVHK